MLHFSPVHPAAIAAALDAARIAAAPQRFFEVDVARLDPARTVVFLNTPESRAEQFATSEWRPLNAVDLHELARLDERTHTYFRDCAARGARPRAFAHVAHVLFRGSLDTSGLRVVDT